MPQTVFDVGDTITSRLDLGVTPDGSTVVTVAVTAPDGTSVAVGSPSGPVNGDQYTVQWVATQTGDYLAVWTVTGTGAGVADKLYNVRPLLTGYARPPWAPTLPQVADKIPTRTLDQTVRADGTFLGTFTGSTTPTDEEAQRIVDAATRQVVAAVGTTLDATLQPLAADAAAWQAAADIELAYPDRNADVNQQPQLQKRAEAALNRLLTANTVDTGTTGTPALLPQWSMPDPVAWGDVFM